MKKRIYLLIISLLFFTNCKDELDCCVFPDQAEITLNFTHYWNETKITTEDFNELKFTTENGEIISIEKLRYLISNISFINGKNYYLVDFEGNSGTSITLNPLKKETYNIKFRFGFSNENNIDGIYKDLNTVNFNVPTMLGGGYHFMQFDGKFLDQNNQEAGFNYHVIKAVNKTDPDNLVFEDTSFEVDLGTFSITNNATIEIKMNLSEWFKNPNIWNLNELNTVLMPNFEAQKMMSSNGKSAFSLGEITQQ